MSQKEKIKWISRPDRITSYFKRELWPLTLVGVSGIIYNVGLLAAPYFEGRLAQCLFDIMQGQKTLFAMLTLVLIYLGVILFVQAMRSIKRFFVRRFANSTARSMRRMLYDSLINMDKTQLESEGLGSLMTKANADVDACVEGMRKFTTEVFDTGVALLAYLAMLFFYDWRLALISCIFTPLAYFIAGRLKRRITQYSAEYKKSAASLNAATMDRISNALTYRVYGCEALRDEAYEAKLQSYEKRAVAANIWENSMQPIYNVISMCGVVLVIFFGAKNVQGGGWTAWDIAAFTTFLSCFTKMALKSSKAAKLFNSVQKAQVSWARIKPLMKEHAEPNPVPTTDPTSPAELRVSDMSVFRPDGTSILSKLSFSAQPGQLIGVTGPVACGKSALGKAFIGELSYGGSVEICGRELSSLSELERSELVSYMGHEPELLSQSIEENIRLGKSGDTAPFLKAVCLDEDLKALPQGSATPVGSGGVRLSGGQQSRTALARTLFNAKKLLVLDDPFSAVDKATETAILKNLRSLGRDKIVILISHRLSIFPELDGVVFLSDGGGVFSSHEQLLEHCEAYAKLYRAQLEGGAPHEG